MKTVAVITGKIGVAVIRLFIKRTERGHIIEIQEEIPLVSSEDDNTALLHDTINFFRPIADYIKQYPSDWLWIHRRWKRIKK